MSDMMSKIAEDIEHYKYLCSKYGEKVQDPFDPNPYGRHADKLLERESLEQEASKVKISKKKELKSVETEVKIELNREMKVGEIYEALGRPKWEVQKNYLFSVGEGFLRIRYENGKAYMTAKGKRLTDKFNSRPEIECEIPAEFFMSFAKLRGANASPVHYEKSRASKEFMNCEVCLDNFFGRYYLEIEGIGRNIDQVISHFELQKFPIEKRSYLEMLGEMSGGKNG